MVCLWYMGSLTISSGIFVLPVREEYCSIYIPAVQPRFDINFPQLSGYTRNLAFKTPWGNYFTLGLCAANKRCSGLSNMPRHRPLRVPIHTLVEWRLRVSFFVPREFHIEPEQDSNQRPLDLQISFCLKRDYDRMKCVFPALLQVNLYPTYLCTVFYKNQNIIHVQKMMLVYRLLYIRKIENMNTNIGCMNP